MFWKYVDDHLYTVQFYLISYWDSLLIKAEKTEISITVEYFLDPVKYSNYVQRASESTWLKIIITKILITTVSYSENGANMANSSLVGLFRLK